MPGAAEASAEDKAPNNKEEGSAAATPEGSIIEWASQLLEDWQRRWSTTGAIAKGEFMLSVRALLFALMFAVMTALLLVFAWLSALVLAVWLLLKTGVALWILLTGVLVLHLLLAIWIGQNIRRLLREVGFQRTVAAIKPGAAPTPE